MATCTNMLINAVLGNNRAYRGDVDYLTFAGQLGRQRRNISATLWAVAGLMAFNNIGR